ncbi:alanine acetyltransferase [Bacillus coahuilensis p1.1.43]|uniref:Alanine acetyltransferase n=1 Tax=Bacillus coahuilensis p1.1.43 TaxID=1150625 RepID=A0A147K579_9BACI|nr:ribosomal protein S18-alanine N-acetyltransferase [Bacillus coahuilensis]KUP04739.1 alanine acetyltransferase [Bacillus coahuilensis p1.1.43]
MARSREIEGVEVHIADQEIMCREMQLADLDEVLVVENDAFTLPWKRSAFENELEHNSFARYRVLVEKEQIIGYCGMWLVVDEAHITNIAILSRYRGRKLGDWLLSIMMKMARDHGATKMTLEVRVSNEPALGLYKKLGFVEGGIRKGYYSDNQEDAIVMWVNL